MRGCLQAQRESCDRPTAHPTVSVSSCHSLSHASPAKHRAPSPVVCPLSQSPFTSSYPHLRSVWMLCEILIRNWWSIWGLALVLFMCVAAKQREVRGEFFWAGAHITDWHSFTAPARLCYRLSGSKAGGVCGFKYV